MSKLKISAVNILQWALFCNEDNFNLTTLTSIFIIIFTIKILIVLLIISI